MTKRATIVTVSVDEAKAAISRGESQSDFAAADRLTDEDIRRQAASDPEEREWDWANASPHLLTLRR